MILGQRVRENALMQKREKSDSVNRRVDGQSKANPAMNVYIKIHTPSVFTSEHISRAINVGLKASQ